MTREEVLKIAQTASLTIEDHEIEDFVKDLDKMIGFARQLEELDTTNVDLTQNDDGLYNVFRKDEVKPSMAKEELLANSPQSKNGCFFVPQIVE